MKPKPHHTGMAVIAAFKLFKGILLLLFGFGLLKLVHAEIATLFSLLIESLHLNTDSQILHALLLRVDALRPDSVLMMSVVSLAYGVLLLIEGVGLWFERAWAAYLTTISTSLFLPVEIYEIVQHMTLVRIAVFVANVAIVLYLITQLRHHTLRAARSTTR